MGWRRGIRDTIAELETRRLRLEQLRLRAQRIGGSEGKRLEDRTRDQIQEISQRIDDLRASLE